MAAAPIVARLSHIVDAVAQLQRLRAQVTFETFSSDPVLAAAGERFLERICETVQHLPAEHKDNHPEIPWAQKRGLGNRLRHGYEAIDVRLTWDIITNDLAPLREAVTAIIQAEQSRSSGPLPQ